MLSIFLFLAMTSASTDLVSAAIESYKSVENYQVTLMSKSADSSEVIRYFYKRPGFVRMEFIKPHKGAVLVYNPSNKKVRLRPFGLLKPFVLTLDPDSSLVKSPKGHRVDESDIGKLLQTAKALQGNGTTEVLKNEGLGERIAKLIRVEGKDGFSVDGIHSYLLWLDGRSFLPIKASSYNADGGLIEEILMDDLEVNTNLSEELFDL